MEEGSKIFLESYREVFFLLLLNSVFSLGVPSIVFKMCFQNVSFFTQVFDGLSDQSPMLGRFCTSVAPSPVETTGPYAFVRFHSDGDGTGEGFMVTYSSAQRTFNTIQIAATILC